MEKKVYELKISKTLEHVMPPLSELELHLLQESLLSEGCREPLVVWDGVLIDGHNRFRICQEHQIPFSYIEMEFKSEDEAKIWIIKNQLARRNVTAYVRCELILPLEAALKAEAKKRQVRKPADFAKENLPEQSIGSQSRDELGKLAGVSGKTMMKVKKIAEEADEETKDKLRNGELSIHKAYTQLIEKAEAPSQVKKPGDIVPGHGVEQILGPRKEGAVIRQPDSVYGIPPIEVFGNTPSGNTELRGKAEMAHARSALESSTENYIRSVCDALRSMSKASVNEENMQALKEIITDGYDTVMDLFKLKLNGGKNDEEN